MTQSSVPVSNGAIIGDTSSEATSSSAHAGVSTQTLSENKGAKMFTLEEIVECTGTSEDGKILLALLGKVYDVTTGNAFYGPGWYLQ